METEGQPFPEEESALTEETPNTEETPVDAAPSEETQVEATATQGEDAGAAPVDGEVADWTPTLKYKVKDSEYDIPEWAHGLIKDEATEKELKTLFSKGHGIEEIKEDRQGLRDQLTDITTQKESIDQSLNVLSEYVQKGDLRSFFDALQIPKDMVMKYAIEELKYQEMPAEQRQEIDNRRMRDQQLNELQYQNQTLQQQFESQQIEHKRNELNMAMSDPTTQSVVQQFDAAHGAGAFQQEVIRRGVAHFHQNGVDIPPNQAVQEVIGLIGALGNTADPAATPPQSGLDQAPAKKPVIPNMRGKSTSPVRSQPSSIDDLRKIAEQMA